MGTNRRYADRIDRQMDERILATIAAKGGLQSLSAAELALDREQLTIDPEPKPVLAWVRFYGEAVRVRGFACRWTPKAVGVKFTAGGKEYTTWVWSDAVELDQEVRPPSDAEKYGPQ
ncbi:hypothetical protein Q9R08_04850 [Microbacterium sp. QXD-8]|uniref:Lipoprotein n=1 Tax=Microbacterium psychrotolerans TaxID=3068321 RepID=A0ABU0YY96_9MICO|nr:hypothetical protein [Microbacterium sp. QXD-8]MDQ7877300.1 hypothetical protein [Microbacterium sp. QXD-8]